MEQNTNKLVDMLKSTFKPALEEGKYTATLKSFEVVANPTADYVKFTFTLESGREITENRFEKGLGVMISHLRQQLGREKEEIIPQDFFNELIANKTPFNIWIVKRIVNGVQKTNFNFLEPLKTNQPAESTITVVDDNLAESTEENES